MHNHAEEICASRGGSYSCSSELASYAERARLRSQEIAQGLAPSLLKLAGDYVEQLLGCRTKPALMRELPPAHALLMGAAAEEGAGAILNWLVLEGISRLPPIRLGSGDSGQAEAAAACVRYLNRMFEHICRSSYEPGSEELIKDIRFAYGMSLPVDAWWIDVRSRLAARLGLWYWMRNPAVVLRSNPSHLPCARLYVEPRLLSSFDESCLRRAFDLSAKLMLADKTLAGLTVKSWFCDPVVADISPRLGYLTSIAVDGGATLIRGGASKKDVQRATAKSPTRHRLYVARKYRPTAYTMFWPRTKLVAWAAREAPAS